MQVTAKFQPIETMEDSVDTQKETDQQLVARVQQGDMRAFDLLVIKYQHKVLALVSRFVNGSADTQDVAQDTFIKAYRALNNFRGDSAFYTWLYRIAVNTAKNHLASRAHRASNQNVELDDAELLSEQANMRDIATPDRLLQKDQLQTVVFDAMAQLPEDLRMALTLRELEGLSYEDIADVMDCPIGTVRSRIFRAREAVDEKIRPLIDGAA